MGLPRTEASGSSQWNCDPKWPSSSSSQMPIFLPPNARLPPSKFPSSSLPKHPPLPLNARSPLRNAHLPLPTKYAHPFPLPVGQVGVRLVLRDSPFSQITREHKFFIERKSRTSESDLSSNPSFRCPNSVAVTFSSKEKILPQELLTTYLFLSDSPRLGKKIESTIYSLS